MYLGAKSIFLVLVLILLLGPIVLWIGVLDHETYGGDIDVGYVHGAVLGIVGGVNDLVCEQDASTERFAKRTGRDLALVALLLKNADRYRIRCDTNGCPKEPTNGWNGGGGYEQPKECEPAYEPKPCGPVAMAD